MGNVVVLLILGFDARDIFQIQDTWKQPSYSVTIQLLQLGHWVLPLERQDERVEKVVGLFAAGRKVGADDAKGISAGFRAETTGDFLLEFGHSQVAFGLVGVEGNAPVGEEAQDLVAVLAQSPNEVAGRGLFDSPASARTAGTGRIASFGFGEDSVVAGPQALDVAGGQCLEVLGLGLADQGLGLAGTTARSYRLPTADLGTSQR